MTEMVLEKNKFEEIDDGDSDWSGFEEEGGGRPGCDWNEGCCKETSTHYIFWNAPCDDHWTDYFDFLCDRHYALSLVRFVTVDHPYCSVAPLKDHVKRGELGA